MALIRPYQRVLTGVLPHNANRNVAIPRRQLGGSGPPPDVAPVTAGLQLHYLADNENIDDPAAIQAWTPEPDDTLGLTLAPSSAGHTIIYTDPRGTQGLGAGRYMVNTDASVDAAFVDGDDFTHFHVFYVDGVSTNSNQGLGSGNISQAWQQSDSNKCFNIYDNDNDGIARVELRGSNGGDGREGMLRSGPIAQQAFHVAGARVRGGTPTQTAELWIDGLAPIVGGSRKDNIERNAAVFGKGSQNMNTTSGVWGKRYLAYNRWLDDTEMQAMMAWLVSQNPVTLLAPASVPAPSPALARASFRASVPVDMTVTEGPFNTTANSVEYWVRQSPDGARMAGFDVIVDQTPDWWFGEDELGETPFFDTIDPADTAEIKAKLLEVFP